MTATLTIPEPVTLTTCDRCGAAGAQRVILPSGLDLTLCQHHTNANVDALVLAGALFTPLA